MAPHAPRAGALSCCLLAALTLLAARPTAAACQDCRANLGGYCLGALAAPCSATVNAACGQTQPGVCDLYTASKRHCTMSPNDCAAGTLLFPDDPSTTTHPKWKAVPDVTKKFAATGIESIASDPSKGATYDAMFAKIWASSYNGQNPTSTKVYTKTPAALAINSFAHRTRHLLHIHLGARTAQLEACVVAAAQAIKWAPRTWSPTPFKGAPGGPCDFSNVNKGGNPNVWVYLEPSASATSAPANVGQAVWKAFNNGGPLAALRIPPSNVDVEAHRTSLAMTAVRNGGKYYHAVLLANSWKTRIAGEHQFLEDK